ncbi:MAG: tellurite resistance TerB family protein [Chthoniobacterales bacterium]
MGLFDKLSGRGDDGALTKQEGFAGIMLAVVAADGHVSDEESDDFIARANRMKLLASQSAAEFKQMIDKLFRILNSKGSSDLIARSAQALTPELRETAFAVSMDMIFADGSVADAEKAMIEKLQRELEITDDLAGKILDVMLVKHRG